MSYLDLDGFRDLTLMPAEDVDFLEAGSPGWIARQLNVMSAKIDARLSKRYTVPFQEPYPELVQSWLASVTTLRAYLRRGVDPTDLQFEEIRKDAENAWAEIEEAANGETGLFELPAQPDESGPAVTRGGPRTYTEASPYVWSDRQAAAARDEDRNRTGTGG